MGLDRIIKLTFTEPLEEKHIISIINKAIYLGSIFYNYTEEKFACTLLSATEIAEHFYQKDNNDCFGGHLYMNNDTSYVSFSIYQAKNQKATLKVFLEVDYWEHPQFEHHCDYERYIRFLLKIIQGIPLHTISIEFEM